MSLLADRAVTLVDYLFRDGDDEHNMLLEGLLRGVLDPADRISLIAHGDHTREPLEVVLNPAKAELWSIDYACQWNGGSTPRRRPGETDTAYLARARRAAARPLSMARGSRDGLIDIGQPFVTGAGACRLAIDRTNAIVSFIVRTGSVLDMPGLTAALNDDRVVTAGWKINPVETDAPTVDEWARAVDAVAKSVDTLTLEDVN